MKKLITLIVTLVVAMNSLHISAQAIHEFSVYGSSGLSTLRYQLSMGDRSGGFGGDFGAGYTYLILRERAVETGTVSHQQWGIHTGIGLGFYNAKAKLNNQTAITKGLNDGELFFSNFDLYSTISGYKETQKAILLNIPVMAQYQLDQYYFMGGFKFGIPLSGKYKSKGATLTNKAYYPELGSWATTQEFRGYGTFTGMNSNGKIDLGVSTMFSLESGMMWRIDDNFSLYTGAYFDYGLNNVVKGKKNQFVNYNTYNPTDFTTNSVLSSSYSDDSKPTAIAFTDKVNTMAVGIKVRLTFIK